MALYEYRCRSCGETWTDPEYGLEREYRHHCKGAAVLDSGFYESGEIVRVYSFAFHRDFAPHYNYGMGAAVSSKRQLEEELRKKSEEATNRTGVLHDYRSADLRDRDIFPVTDEGLDSTYAAHDPSSPVRRAIETVK